jgi:hypothetical protein
MKIVERRAYVRHAVDFETALVLPDGTVVPARVVDLSARGVRITLDDWLPHDTRVQMVLEHYGVQGHVRYCCYQRLTGRYVAGVYLDRVLEQVEELARLGSALLR